MDSEPPKKLPRATHGAPDRPLKIGGVEIPCYVLNDGRRVITQTGAVEALAMSRGGGHSDRLAGFVGSSSIKPYAPKSLGTAIQPFEFIAVGSGARRALGYEATILADICEAVLASRRAGSLHAQQAHIAERAEILMAGFARVGIIALVDEATGYEKDKKGRELAELLAYYISPALLPWTKKFPDSFFREMFRLKGWQWHGAGSSGPRYAGKLVRQVVYERLPGPILTALESMNPSDEGHRANKHHQFINDGEPQQTLNTILSISTHMMKAAKDWDHFEELYDRACPRPDGWQQRLSFQEPPD